MKEFVFPKGTVNLTEEEQEKRIAGFDEIPVSPLYLAKTACEIKAGQEIVSGKVTRMTFLEIAQEIFGHACAYYATSTLVALGVNNAQVNELRLRANPIYLADGGDSTTRKALYALIWAVTPSVLSPV